MLGVRLCQFATARYSLSQRRSCPSTPQPDEVRSSSIYPAVCGVRSQTWTWQQHSRRRGLSMESRSRASVLRSRARVILECQSALGPWALDKARVAAQHCHRSRLPLPHRECRHLLAGEAIVARTRKACLVVATGSYWMAASHLYPSGDLKKHPWGFEPSESESVLKTLARTAEVEMHVVKMTNSLSAAIAPHLCLVSPAETNIASEISG